MVKKLKPKICIIGSGFVGQATGKGFSSLGFNVTFLDINPYSKGHLLVIPKKHSDWLWDMQKEEYVNLMNKVYDISKVLRKSFDTDWIEEVVAGIGVQHTHIHLLPRKRDDGCNY